jgi:aryl-alcohol dehydrogenase-like predicted oxidoreductase
LTAPPETVLTDSKRSNDENFPKNLDLVEKLMEIGKRKGVTSGQLTLAWLMAQGDDIIPIPGTKKIKYLEENMDSLKVDITREEDEEIRAAIDRCGVFGARLLPVQAALAFMDTPPKA